MSSHEQLNGPTNTAKVVPLFEIVKLLKWQQWRRLHFFFYQCAGPAHDAGIRISIFFFYKGWWVKTLHMLSLYCFQFNPKVYVKKISKL